MKASPPSSENLQAPGPITSETAPPASPPVEKRPVLSAERAAALHKVQWRRGFSSLGAARRNVPVVRLREHQTHGRGS